MVAFVSGCLKAPAALVLCLSFVVATAETSECNWLHRNRRLGAIPVHTGRPENCLVVFGNNAASQTQTIAIRVSGDSMINAGIFPNDVLIAEYVRGTYVKPNTRDIVIARIEDAITVKRYYINDA